MPSDAFKYETWVEEALRKVIHRALEQTRTEGLTGEHHFFITFQTTDDDVEIPAVLMAEHPEEMTIVLQHQFHDLIVDEDGFAVTLSFNGRPSRLVVPFKAVTTFADPAVNFVLQLKMTAEIAGKDTADNATDSAPDMAPDGTSRAPEIAGAATQDEKMGEVIALDAFRKK